MAIICRSDLEDVMEHKTLDQIRDVADILPDWLRARPLSRRERLEGWAEAQRSTLPARPRVERRVGKAITRVDPAA
jgi:hypothetical protein